MDLGLGGKIVFITGGSKGIGLACARAFAGEGARVAVVSRNPENLDRAKQLLGKDGFEVTTIRANLTDPREAQAAVQSAEQQLGPIDALINSAGAAKRHLLNEYTSEAWHHGMDAKYFPYVHAMDGVRAGMIERKRGTIVNIIGMGGKVGQPSHLAGGAANAALMLVTVGWAQALGKYGIRVNGINPAGTFTERVQRAVELEARELGIPESDVMERNQRKIPLGRYCRPEEVAAVALFLASEQASYITGVVVPMDGGLHPMI